jgi:hypothetical protein
MFEYISPDPYAGLWAILFLFLLISMTDFRGVFHDECHTVTDSTPENPKPKGVEAADMG